MERQVLIAFTAFSFFTSAVTIPSYWSADPPLPFERELVRSIGEGLFPLAMLLVTLLVIRPPRTASPDRPAKSAESME